jgi:hypothetical protein
VLGEHPSCGSTDNDLSYGSLGNKFHYMSSVISIFLYNDIFIFFSFVSNLSTWSLFFVCDTLGFLCFLQRLSTLAFEKLQQNEKKNPTIFREIFFCWMFIIDSWIMWAHSTTIYLASNYIWGYKSLTIIQFNK